MAILAFERTVKLSGNAIENMESVGLLSAFNESFTCDHNRLESCGFATAGVGALITHTLTVPLGSTPINFKRTGVGLNLRIAGVTVYNSASKVLDIQNIAVAGSTSITWTNSSNAWSPLNAVPLLGADVCFINICINDFITGTPLPTYNTNISSLIAVNKVVSDVVIFCPVPRQNISTPITVQTQYINIIKSLASPANFDLPIMDITNLYQSQETANAAGWMYDQTHPNSRGYTVMAQLMAAAFHEALLG